MNFWILGLAALAPALFLMGVIYRQDKIEKEPTGLLLKLVIGGCIAGGVAIILELTGDGIIRSFMNEDSFAYIVVENFLVIGFSEEIAKFFFLKMLSWKHPAFNYRFDGIVYAVFTSLGFAALENVLYVFNGGLITALYRAVLSIPAHTCFAVFMGYFYGRAKLAYNEGEAARCRVELIKGIISAMLVHGLYDASLSIDTTLSVFIFFAFVILMDITIFRLVKKESRTDAPIV